ILFFYILSDKKNIRGEKMIKRVEIEEIETEEKITIEGGLIQFGMGHVRKYENGEVILAETEGKKTVTYSDATPTPKINVRHYLDGDEVQIKGKYIIRKRMGNLNVTEAIPIKGVMKLEYKNIAIKELIL